MNRKNEINGRGIDRHPMSDREGLGIYVKGTSVIAGQAQIAGVIHTPEGDMTFQPGDYIVTDNPPTHAWPVRQQVFETTYQKLDDVEEGQIPTSSPVQSPNVPDLSVPPTNVSVLKTEQAAEAFDPTIERVHEGHAGQTAVAADKAAATAPRSAKPAPSKPGKGRGIADSKSLGLQDD